MDTATAAIPYSGPRPSPARAWALPVLVAAALCGLGNATLLVLNLVERHYQQQRLAGHPPSVTRIRDTLSMIHTFATLTLYAAIAFAVLGIIWGTRRRTKSRLARDGESGVEPPLRTVAPPVYWTFWIATGLSFLANIQARSKIEVGSTINDIIDYRTFLAVGHSFRIVTWTSLFVLVLKATALQDRRELAADVPQPERDSTVPSPAFDDDLRTATRNCAVAMLAAGDPANESARRSVIQVARNQGLERYEDAWIDHDLNMLDSTRVASYLARVAPHLDQQRKEALVAEIAAVGLADGPLTPAETNVLETIRAALGLS